MAISKSISYYERINDIKSNRTIPLDIFFEFIRDGKWQDVVLPIRVITDKKERDAKKQYLPSVTISGKFTERYDEKLEQHSGYLGVDIDEEGLPERLDVQEFKSLICADRYCVAAFVSASGRGLCTVFKVVPSKHREAFQGICEYIYSKYGAICDPTSVNESRPRFVSYDPHIYINHGETSAFTQYPKEKAPKKIERVIYAKNDFDQIIQQIQSRHLDLTKDSYFRYLRIGFALVHQFGENGRDYFHLICQFSAKYDSNRADKQFNACLRHKSSNETTISTIYYFCKQDGIELYTERTKKIAYTTSAGKKAGLKPEQIAENLAKYEDIHDAQDIIQQVWDNNIVLTEESILDQVEMFIRQNYNLRRNVITRYIENEGKPQETRQMNSIFIKCKKIFGTLNFDLMDRLINSDFVPDYNPFLEFIEANKELKPTGNIEKLFSCIINEDPAYCLHFGRKWLAGLISSIHGEHSPLVWVMVGDKIGAGKTEFLRRLLPKDLIHYYAESKLDAGKDDYILMTQKLIVSDDEMGGKSKKESKLLKDLCSKQVFSLREPYGRSNVDLVRLASLAGTTNDFNIISDVNRRIIPIRVDSVNQALYNSIDKTELFMEAYWLWKSGFEWRVLGDDIKYLQQDEDMFEMKTSEGELIVKYFREPEANEIPDKMTATDIRQYIQNKSGFNNLSLNIIWKELHRLGYTTARRKVNGKSSRAYNLIKVENDINNNFKPN